MYFFSFLLLGEALTMQKGAAVAVSVGGVALVSFAKQSTDDTDIHPSTLGYMMVVVSTCLYALYEVMYARYAEGHGGHEEQGEHGAGAPGPTNRLSDGDQSEEPLLYDSEPQSGAVGSAGTGAAALGGSLAGGAARGQRRGGGGGGGGSRSPLSPSLQRTPELLAEPAPRSAWRASAEEAKEQEAEAAEVWLQLELSCMVLGLIGVWSVLCLWPLFFILNVSKVEPFRFPSAGVLEILLGNVVLDCAYNSLLLFGVALAGPLAMSVGCMLVVPASILADYFIHHTLLTPMAVGGVLLIVAGFVLLKTTPGCLRWMGAAVGCIDDSESSGGAGRREGRGSRDGVGRSDSRWDGLSMAGVDDGEGQQANGGTARVSEPAV